MSDSLINLNKFEQKNIEINREEVMEQTTVHNLEDFLQKDDVQIQTSNAYISRLKVNLKALYDGEHESITLERVKETVSELTGMWGTEVDYISKLMDVSNALDAFLDTHQGTYFMPYKRRRKMLVYELKKIVQEMLLNQQQKMDTESDYTEKPNVKKRRNAINITEARIKQAESGVEELEKCMRKWKERMGEYIISTPEEMIRAKLALFEPYMEDIEAYRFAKNKSKKCQKLLDEYDSLGLRADLINWDKSKEGRAESYKNKSMEMAKEVAQNLDSDLVEKKAMDKEFDKDLTKEQAAGIQSIDRWMIRNFSNSGVVGLLGTTRFDNAQESFVQKILSLSKRERLYLYYMVETKARKTANAGDLVKSQAYVPNLSEFKNQMLATKFKITKHLTGGYVYWHKLTEAMQRLNGQGKLLESFLRGKKELSEEEKENSQLIKELDKEEKEFKDGVQEEKIINQEEEQENEQENEFAPVKITNVAKERMKDLEDFHRAIKKLALAIQKGYSKKVINKAKADSDQIYEKLLEKDEEVKKYVGKEFDKAGETVGYVLEGVDYASKGVSNSPQILANTAGLFWDVRSWNWVSAQKGLVITSGTLDALTTFAGVIGGILALKESYSSTANIDLAEQTLGLTLGTLGLGLGIWGAVEMAAIAKETAQLFMENITLNSAEFAGEAVSKAGFGLAVMGFGLAAFQGVVAYKHNRDLKSAKAYFAVRDEIALKDAKKEGNIEKERKAQKEARFNQNIAKISQIAIEKKRDSAIFATVLGTIGVATAAMPLLAPLATGAMAVTAVMGLIQKGVKAKKKSDAQKQVFDDYFNVDKIYEEVMKNDPRFNKVKAGGSAKAAEKRKEAIKMNIRRQLAAAYGFSNIWDARIYITSQYAEYIRSKLYPTRREDGKYDPRDRDDMHAMETFIKSLGLDVDRQEGKPTIDQLRSKLS